MAKKSIGKIIAFGTLISAGVGYLAGILTAPKSGKETRKDIVKNASRMRIKSEKQLKQTHSELVDLIKEGEVKLKKAGTKANSELKESTEKAKVAREKAREILSALHNGDADDPNLQAVVEEIKLAKSNLVKYLKKKP